MVECPHDLHSSCTYCRNLINDDDDDDDDDGDDNNDNANGDDNYDDDDNDNDDDYDDIYLYKSQRRILKNLHHMFPSRPVKKILKKISILKIKITIKL
jgi:hypothetical protein